LAGAFILFAVSRYSELEQKAPPPPAQSPEPTTGKTPLKELLVTMPSAGEDADFERAPDLGRQVDP